MLALILAGGSGTRLNMGEKPLVDICGQPMLWYVVRAFRKFGSEPLVILSRQTPYTRNWCRVNQVDHFLAESGDYMGDIIETVTGLSETGPVLISACDLPAVDAEILQQIWSSYEDARLPALSTWVPRNVAERFGCMTTCTERVDGCEASPAGINVLRGDLIAEEQEEHRLLVRDRRIALNVNTRDSLDAACRLIARRQGSHCAGE
ncbi:MAG: NTP transferase domain-containing protein [Methanoregulaceae archaeon]|nr:NTP transferase domain-containing protein [Methanoregulaceae archaeon]